MALDWSSLIFRDVPLSFSLIALVWFILNVLKAKLSQKRPMPPGPPPHWFSGNADVFQSNVEERHLRLLEFHKKYGKVVRIQMGRPPLFGREMFSIADPDLCEEVLKSKSYAVSKLSQARFKRVIGANNLVTLEGEQWKKHRRLIMPLFHSGFLSYALEVISDKTQFVIRKWQGLSECSSVETFAAVQSLTLDVISQAAFGYDLKVQENPDNESVQVLTSFLGHFGEIAFLVFPSFWSWMHPFRAFQVRQLQSELDNLINQIIQQRRSEGDSDNKRDLLTLLLRAQDPESKYKLTDVEVHDEILTFIFGGFETITSQLCWVLFHLAQNPDIQAVAQEEVDRVLGYSDEVTSEMEKELKYVTNCIKESQRLIPVITGFSRGAVEDTELGVDGEVISSIGKGLCVLLGISKYDTSKEIEYMVRKILNLRVFDDNGQRWKKSVVDKNLEILCVSQFTLQAVLKGNKPDYHLAMGGDQSENFYQDFLQHMRSAYRPDAIKDGKFGAYMQVQIQNDGPVTISLETPPPKPVQQKQGKGNSKAVKTNEDSEASTSSADQEKDDGMDPEQQINNFDELNFDEKQASS